MSEARSFINSRTQSYQALKASTPVSGHAQGKFDVLNAHIANSVVMGGELVIVGDPDTPSCTSHEAFLMAKAAQVHAGLLTSGVDADDFFLEHFDLLQSVLANASMGVGAVGDGWSRHLQKIKDTLEEIEKLHRDYLGSGTLSARDAFYAKRTALFMKLEKQLGNFAAYGSGLRNQGKVKQALGISTRSYLHTGEIAGYADKVSGVAKASNLVKKGTYIGTALDVAATGLSIHKACTMGREEQCRRAKYVESSALIGGLGGGSLGGYAGGMAGAGACVVVLGVTTGGPGALVCAVVGGAVGGKIFGDIGSWGGEMVGDYLYREVSE
ncbi:TPA: hypothetical protein QEM76_002689 [Pseudomonas putida]|uniref:hypothetical protein n=1 Tax=Pseudomonas putida TaxID=303 RepID=UPI00235BF474|nr:hypothetical protein [Pseudomonas putida]GLO08186.1 hypothetical protein PPUJ20005_21550 [Pseudomonas putida]HDS0983454.1 hypothetical protein [Pseudomonas putida]HDS1799585.1 hypothetical protein [Pseudomonas putida]HDS1805990.1 hypothetical protein [Pseudomonas putida]